MTEPQSLTSADLAAIDARLAATDELLATAYPGEGGERQPIHTVYAGAHLVDAGTIADWGARALAAAEEAGGLRALAERLSEVLGLGDDPDLDPGRLAALVEEKLAREPIEDLRIDFEDGFGNRTGEEEDAAIDAAVATIAQLAAADALPPHIGIRSKCFETPTRDRAIRTFDRFITGLARTGAFAGSGGLPAGLELTLPKVTTVDQVVAMVEICERLEAANGLEPGRIRFEVQVETPQVVIGPDGTTPLASLIHAGKGRVSSLHYGTYDYSASLGVAGGHQSMEHPVADFAKSMMQVAIAGTGVRMSDGSTNILPLGDAAQREAAWALHARLVRRSLERAIYQGWDLHAHQLPTRYLASYAFFRTGLASTCERLHNYVNRIESAVMDEPATARALAAFLVRGVNCGAVPESEVVERVGLGAAELVALAHPPRPASTVVPGAESKETS